MSCSLEQIPPSPPRFFSSSFLRTKISTKIKEYSVFFFFSLRLLCVASLRNSNLAWRGNTGCMGMGDTWKLVRKIFLGYQGNMNSLSLYGCFLCCLCAQRSGWPTTAAGGNQGLFNTTHLYWPWTLLRAGDTRLNAFCRKLRRSLWNMCMCRFTSHVLSNCITLEISPRSN